MFIHGLWLHPTSWAAWEDLFGRAGYETSSPEWPDEPETVEAARSDPEALANKGIEDIVDHYRGILGRLGADPILVGHSFGGLFAEKSLGEGRGAAAAAIDAAQVKGVLRTPLSALRATLPVFKNPANRHRMLNLSAEQFRCSFGNAVSKEESDQICERWAVPGPARPLFEAATTNLEPHAPSKVDMNNPARGPLLLVVGGQDHTVPESVTKATAKKYKHSPAETDTVEFRRPCPLRRLGLAGGGRGVAQLDREARPLTVGSSRAVRDFSEANGFMHMLPAVTWPPSTRCAGSMRLTTLRRLSGSPSCRPTCTARLRPTGSHSSSRCDGAPAGPVSRRGRAVREAIRVLGDVAPVSSRPASWRLPRRLGQSVWVDVASITPRTAVET
jgi:pimeloyl-ACP methyl ester carboxylesterase